MNTLMKITIISAVAGTITLSGCSNEPSTTETPAHTDDHGHDHQAPGHEDHDHAHEEEEEDDVQDGHGSEVPLGIVEIDGTVLKVSLLGEVTPGTEADVDIFHTEGPAPIAIRLWIGDEGAAGALKSKAEGQSKHFHGHVEAPADISEAALWMEVEFASGQRTARSVPLP